jgi:hypothetical protein
MSYVSAPQTSPVVCGIDDCNTSFAQERWSNDFVPHLLMDHVGLAAFLLRGPSVTCNIDACGATILLDREHEWMSAHLVSDHGYVLDGNRQTICRWIIAHPCSWHGRGSRFLDHVVESHLGFVYSCSVCGVGPFASDFSQQRHENSACRGRIPARCQTCLKEFPSISALGGHAELGLCWPA